jgi:DNA-binding NtrC family response regulator
VLVVSGGGWANEVDARKLGMTTFFRKPLDLDGFIAAVERACRPAALD